jgi:2-polyprenyl-3-methyl-5-hydroxy-6-metoxy-1,4-benzoquinol methylase
MSVAALDQAKLSEFVGKFVGDIGAALHAPLVLIGERLGLYKAMADTGPVTPADLASHTGTDERYVREWLCAQAASGYAEYDPDTGRFALSPEQAFALANESGPVYLPGAFQIVLSMMRDIPKLADAFLTGEGLGWHEHDHALFYGIEKFYRPNYAGHLTSSWIPALDGVEEKLTRGTAVADVGCGHGSSTILMAQAYPRSRFTGFDYHPASIARARDLARLAGVSDRVSFEIATAKDYPGHGYDFVACFDCLHDMGDPAGASAHVRDSLAPDGTWMLVEPFANDHVEDNLNSVGRIFYSVSTMICTPSSKAQEVGLALGAQAGEARLRDVVLAGGFTRFRRAAETPFNLVLEARP